MSSLTDLRALIASTPGAVGVVFGAIHLTKAAILDFNGQGWGNPEQAQIGVTAITLTYPYPDLPGLVPGSALSLTDEYGITTPYVCSTGPHRQGDGLEAVITLENT